MNAYFVYVIQNISRNKCVFKYSNNNNVMK